MAYKTPGVYIEEITTLAPSVVAVATAIPAFIGYTETAVDANGNTLAFTPTLIESFLEYAPLYGGDFVPASYQVVLDTAAGNVVGAVTPRDSGNNERHYYLYDSVRHYFANGGGPCYIVSVGSYATAPALGDTTTPAGLLGGLTRVAPVDDPTLLVFPDGVSLSAADLGSLQAAALTQCQTLQDRFTILDLRQGNLAISPTVNPIADFRQNVGMNNLTYGAAYYPWLSTVYTPDVHFRQLSLVTPALAAIPNATIDTLTNTPAIDGLVPGVRNADAVVTTIVSSVNIGAMAGANPLVLTRDNFADLPDLFTGLYTQLRQTDPTAADAVVQQAFSNLLLLPRAIVLALQTLQAGIATLPQPVALLVTELSTDANVVTVIDSLIAYEKNAGVLGSVAAGRTAADVQTAYASLNGTTWIAPNADVTAIAASGDNFAGANVRATALNAASALQALFDGPAAAILSVFSAAGFLADEAESTLFSQHPVFSAIESQVTRTMVLLPPSGAVAGIYAAVDRLVGVWKAPANVSVTDISGVTVKINDQMQEDLNVTSTGKSVNAIRTFTGKGSLVWGARTLAGNDEEWRYVPVRRFFIMAEESIRKATEPFVFEPNDSSTWVRVRAMIENFLTIQWRQGALAGATTPQAFYVKVGLGETMTSQDILEGTMIVEIGMAVVRPAEFIVLRFSHKMQTS